MEENNNTSVSVSELAKRLLGQAFRCRLQGDNDGAIATYTEAIRLEPNYADAYRSRGHVHSYRNDFDKAIADFNVAIRLKPNDAGTHYMRGNAHLRKHEYRKGIADYTEAMRLEPTRAVWYSERARAYAELGDRDSAIADYNEAIRLDPTISHRSRWRGGPSIIQATAPAPLPNAARPNKTTNGSVQQAAPPSAATPPKPSLTHQEKLRRKLMSMPPSERQAALKRALVIWKENRLKRSSKSGASG